MIVYTDGACTNNPGVGGWSYVMVPTHGDDAGITVASGGQLHTTSNRMEIIAIVNALSKLINDSYDNTVLMYTDSKLIVDVVNNHRIDGWIDSNFKGVKNQDLWLKLYKQLCNIDVVMHWVKAHDNNVYNELADRLAREAKFFQGVPYKIDNPINKIK